MRRFVACLSLLLIIPLSACGILGIRPPAQGVPQAATQPPQGNDPLVETQIASVLTIVPTAANQPAAGEATPTENLPTVAVVTATQPAAETPAAGGNAPLPTQTPSSPTATPALQAAAPTATTGPTATTSPTAPSATPTLAPAPAFTPPADDPRARLGTPTSTDPMDNANTWVWPTGSDLFSTGTFGGGYQTIVALTNKDGWRLANPQGRSFGNIYLEGTFRTNTCSGSDHYGLVVRVPILQDADQGYLFAVTCDGKYSLRRWNGKILPNGEGIYLVYWTPTTAVATGSNQVNKLGIFAVGNRLILYANGKLLTEVKDSSYPTGNFGVLVGADNTKNMTVQLDSMSYWENPNP